MIFGISLDFPPVSFLQFWVTFAVGFMLIFFFSLYMLIFVWHFGKPMRKYLKARLTPFTGIIQEYALENVSLKLARVTQGDEFIDLENKVEVLPKKKWWYRTKIISTPCDPLISKSVVSINGVKTLMVWNVNPPLPERYLKAVEALIALKYSTYTKVLEALNETFELAYETVIPGTAMTIKEFVELHESLKNKNSVIVTADDVLSFEDKYLDEHPRKSVIEKEINLKTAGMNEAKYQKYAFGLIALMIVGSFILMYYKIRYGGK